MRAVLGDARKNRNIFLKLPLIGQMCQLSNYIFKCLVDFERASVILKISTSLL